MSIKSNVQELESIKEELKTLTRRRKVLNNRKNELEKAITNYLKEKDQTGVKHQGKAIILEEKEQRSLKKIKERDNDASEILKKYGINNAMKVLNEILDARKGEKIIKEKLVISKLKS